MSDLACDNIAVCGNTFPAWDTTVYNTETRARFQGWRIFHGPLHGGLVVDWVLCPECAGSSTRRIPAPKRLDGEEPLF